jgi:hypothetical protein
MYMTFHRKARLTVTVDAELVAAANAAVAQGEADSVSSWVNKAMTAQSERERRLSGMAAAIADYEAECGELSEAEMAAQGSRDRATATTVGGIKIVSVSDQPGDLR